MKIETAFVLLFAIATAVAVLARRLRIPYTVALVLAGLLLGALHWFPAPALTQDLLFGLFLPGLIFEAAFQIDWREFRANLLTITSLAVPGVIASTALVAWTLTLVAGFLGLPAGFDWKLGLVFGALIAIFLEFSDKSIRTERDAAAVMDLPLLISVPWLGEEEEEPASANGNGNGKRRFWGGNGSAPKDHERVEV